jgi:hypothetical protein
VSGKEGCTRAGDELCWLACALWRRLRELTSLGPFKSAARLEESGFALVAHYQ